MKVVYDTLNELGITGKPVITAFNKSDLSDEESSAHEGDSFNPDARDPVADKTVRISARTGDHIDDLYRAIEDILKENRTVIDEMIPYSEASKLAHIRKYGQLTEEEYTEDGIRIKGYI